MKLISGRRAPALLGSIVVLAASLTLAAPAEAFPSDAWWYGHMSVAKAQRVSKGANVTVAVVDTGVKGGLGDLRGQVLTGRSFVGGNANTDIPDPRDKYSGHGTAMAGYIAGTGAGAGMVGIAPQAKILPVGDSRDGRNADIGAMAEGIRWAAQRGAQVINVSTAGQSGCPTAVQSAVDYAVHQDAIVVAGTGNTPGAAIGFPANCVGAIAVGGLAFSSTFRAWSDSTTGAQLDFVSPADHMKELLLDDTLSNPDSSGTSNSTALVSGTFALLRSKFPKESARQIVTRALWNVHNGLGGKVFAKRVDNSVGYGEILPSYALTEAPPANAANPIYDAIEAHLKAASASTGASAGSSSGASSGASSADPSADPSSGASSDAASDSAGDSGGPSPALIAVIVVVVLLVLGGVGVAVARSRRRPPPGAFGASHGR